MAGGNLFSLAADGGWAPPPQPQATSPIDDDIDLRKIFCGNISFQTEDEALFRLFRPFGDITEACMHFSGAARLMPAQAIIARTPSHRSKGFGFVTFRAKEGARLALSNPNPRLDGRILLCKLAALGRLQNAVAKQTQQPPVPMQQQIQQQLSQTHQQQHVDLLSMALPQSAPPIDAPFATPALWSSTGFDVPPPQSAPPQSADAFFAMPQASTLYAEPVLGPFAQRTTPVSDTTQPSIWSLGSRASAPLDAMQGWGSLAGPRSLSDPAVDSDFSLRF